MKLYDNYLEVKSRIESGINRSTVYSKDEDDVKELVNQLVKDGYLASYKQNNMTNVHWVIYNNPIIII